MGNYTMKKRVSLALAASALALSGFAQAAMLEIDLSRAGLLAGGHSISSSDTGQQLVYSQLTTSGLLEVYAQSLETSGLYWGSIEGLTSFDSGLGINKSWLDDHQVDGNGQNEGVRFDFKLDGISTAMNMRRFGFTYVGSNDDVHVYGNANGGTSMTSVGNVNIGQDSPYAPWPGTVSVNGTLNLASLVLAAQGHDDDFKISSLTIDLGGGIDIIDGEVPLPAALPVFLTGLAGLGFARKKKKTA
jgi:hypothetical protein